MIELEKRASWYFRMSSEQTTKNLETAKEIEGIIRQKWSCSGNHCHTGWSPIHRSSHRGVGVACKVWSPNPKNCSMRHSCCIGRIWWWQQILILSTLEEPCCHGNKHTYVYQGKSFGNSRSPRSGKFWPTPLQAEASAVKRNA
ncbi:uncharacterized protein LOC141644130 isoform X2 [Silene latifolia]|uniref:uncharacterized protein LOC141644130 isoform X2 n=1 Tax=Silene latifolia TaxID=37657 RepID=UPI003D76E3D5